MNGLDDRLSGILGTMRAMPPGVAREVAARLPAILEAIGEDILDEAAIMLAFKDLEDERVVLSITIRSRYAHLDVSTQDEGVAVSNGYDLRPDADDRCEVHVDRDFPMTEIDHGALIAIKLRTETATSQLVAARELMRTHHAFRDLSE